MGIAEFRDELLPSLLPTKKRTGTLALFSKAYFPKEKGFGEGKFGNSSLHSAMP